MLNPKYRYVYILTGFILIIALIYFSVANFADTTALNVLEFTVPALLFFSLAYKTYPREYN